MIKWCFVIQALFLCMPVYDQKANGSYTKLKLYFTFQVAAQNCRKRKMDLISHLEEEVSKTRQQKQILLDEREELYRLRTEWTNKLMNLEASVLLGLNRNPETYSLDYSGPSVKVTIRLANSKV